MTLKANIYLLDTMVLINFAERCESRDLFDDFQKLGVRFQIVEEVEKEFITKPKPIGKTRYQKHTKSGMITVIANDTIEIDTNRLNDLIGRGFGKGELFSALYFISQQNLTFVSDEMVVQNTFKKKFNIKLTRTSDLLTLLVEKEVITETQKDQLFNEMIKNGLWIKRHKKNGIFGV
jgi:predicted nucleic acid-binding protein